MSKRKENDFFNLESSSSSDESEKDTAKVSKWDWDREENFGLYYKTHWEQQPELASKRSREEDDDQAPASSKKKLSHHELDPKEARIEAGDGSSSCLFKLLGHRSSVNRVHWAKATPNLLLSSSMDGTIMIWDLSRKSKSLNQKCARMLDNVHAKSIRNAIWINSETRICSVSFDQSCAITDVETGSVTSRLEHKSLLTAAVQSSDNTVLIGAKGEVIEWDTRTDKPAKVFKSHIGQVQDLLFLNENEFVSAGDNASKESAQFSLVVWDLKTTAILSNQIFHEKFICTCLKLHPLQPSFYAQTHGDYIAGFSAKRPFKMNKFKRFDKHKVQGYAIGFDVSANGRLIGSASSDGCVYLYETETSKLVRRIDAFNRELVRQPCMDAKFEPGPSASRLAVSSWNGLIKVLEF